MNQILNSSLLQKIIFATSLGLIFFLSVINFKNLEKMTEATKLINETYDISLALENVFVNVKDLETANRNYILTQDDSIKKMVFKEQVKLQKTFIKLSQLIKKNDDQVQNLFDLKLLLMEKNKIVENALSAPKLEYNDYKKVREYLLKGTSVMHRIRNKVKEMTNVENVHLNKRIETYDQFHQNSPVINLIWLFVTIILITLSFIMIIKKLKEVNASNEELTMAIETSTMAEQIGKYGTWQYNKDNHEFSFSNNLYKLFNLPEDDKDQLELALSKFCPEELLNVKNKAKKMRVNEFLGPNNFSIVTSKGETKHLRYIGKMVENFEGRKILLGVTTDITEEVLNNLEITQKNIELETSNKELHAFNYVASHDLQEPLRKIETFISRIEIEDFSQLSESSKQYFERIKISSVRMRNLIQDLLQFSRTNTSEKVFQKVDLNEILLLAKNEVLGGAEDGNIILDSEKLPSLMAIPFQMKQLFINLLGNSIKYKKPNNSVKVKIEYKKLKLDELNKVKFPEKRLYHQIIVSDNGLGFESKYKDKIFELFSRLHNKDQIVGTGIGLAICRKIVENHKGTITAKGSVGKGAVFTIILPDFNNTVNIL